MQNSQLKETRDSMSEDMDVVSGSRVGENRPAVDKERSARGIYHFSLGKFIPFADNYCYT